MAVPGFWDPRRRPERPDLSRISIIRFLTETDYPPFNYAGPDGTPAGFNVDLARLICEEIKVACTVQMRRFDTLIDALERQQRRRGDRLDRRDAGDAPAGRLQRSLLPHAGALRRARATIAIDDVRPEALEGKKIAVVAGTAHEAYLKALFTEAELHPYPNAGRGALALKRGEVDLLFGDGISLAFWLNGTDSGELLRIPRRALHGEPLFRRGRRHRGQARQRRCCGRRSTGRCSGCGRRAASPTCGCAISRSARFEIEHLTCGRWIPSVRARRS